MLRDNCFGRAGGPPVSISAAGTTVSVSHGALLPPGGGHLLRPDVDGDNSSSGVSSDQEIPVGPPTGFDDTAAAAAAAAVVSATSSATTAAIVTMAPAAGHPRGMATTLPRDGAR